MNSKDQCPHCLFLEKQYPEPLTDREYFTFTEVFVYLHNGKDYCNKENRVILKELQ